jgi:osmotically-inducible protein OsmY
LWKKKFERYQKNEASDAPWSMNNNPLKHAFSKRGKRPLARHRTDPRILEDFNERLYDDPFLDATGIEVSISDGDIILTGTVEDASSKRRAEDIGDLVSGVKNIENRIRVRNK